MAETRVVSFSELDTLRQCQLKHHLAYIQRWSKPSTGALARGTAWHLVMENHYRALQSAGKRRAEVGLSDSLRAVQGIFETNAEGELLAWMYEGHIAEYGVDEQWDILAVEFKPEIPLREPNGRPSRFRLKARIDLLVRDRSSGRQIVVDHKSCKNLPKDVELDLDDQFGLYTLLMQRTGVDVSHAVHSAARTERLKRPMTSEERFARTPLYRTEKELLQIEADALKAFKIRFGHRVAGDPPRSPNTDTCRWRCDFTEPCLLARKTGRPTGTLMGDFGFKQDFTRH